MIEIVIVTMILPIVIIIRSASMTGHWPAPIGWVMIPVLMLSAMLPIAMAAHDPLLARAVALWQWMILVILACIMLVDGCIWSLACVMRPRVSLVLGKTILIGMVFISACVMSRSMAA
jgi:hypothetical protein